MDRERVVQGIMQEQELLETVQREAGLETEEAARTATKAALSTMGEQLTGDAKQTVASDLPGEFANTVKQSGDDQGKQMDTNEFASRMQGHESSQQQQASDSGTKRQPDPSDADRHLDGVARAVGSAVGRQAADEVRDQLPGQVANALESGNTGNNS